MCRLNARQLSATPTTPAGSLTVASLIVRSIPAVASVWAARRGDVEYDAGATYLYRYQNGLWTYSHRTKATDLNANAHLGSAAAVAGPFVLVGASGFGVDPTATGAVYAFEATFDCDGNGRPDGCQLGDTNGDGAKTVDDFGGIAACLTGPDVNDAAATTPMDFCCNLADQNADGAVDLRDAATWITQIDRP